MPERQPRTTLAAIVVGLIVIVALTLAVIAFWPTIAPLLNGQSLETTAETLRTFGPWTVLGSVLLMTLQSVIAPLPGSFVAAANGIIFGIWWGTLISWAGGMCGALATYAIGRWARGGLSQRLVDSRLMGQIGRLSERHGFWIVLIARIAPILSLDAIGYLAGLGRMRFRSYLLANAIGVFPGMAAYTILGADLPQAQESAGRIALVVLALLLMFLLARWSLRRLQVIEPPSPSSPP